MDQDRREFLKRAGAAAWVVPAMQVVNMASAAAGVEGSVVTTGPPTPSTTQGPPEQCDCSLTIVDVDPTGFGSYSFYLGASIDCDIPAARAAVLAHPNSGNKAYLPKQPNGTWKISVQEENLPADITMEFYDADDNAIASCGTRLELRDPV